MSVLLKAKLLSNILVKCKGKPLTAIMDIGGAPMSIDIGDSQFNANANEPLDPPIALAISVLRAKNKVNLFFALTSLPKATLLTFLEMNMDEGMRVKYREKHETFTELAFKEPIGQFRTWFEEACATPGIMEANAMCLATSTKNGTPSARYVLLKGYGTDGFKFFTNYDSRKGKELKDNPKAALVFYWDVLKRSVRVEGTVERVSPSESDEYFASRPFGSSIGACVSQQSCVIADRDVLVERETNLKQRHKDGEIPLTRPDCWGGYIVRPSSVEFWQGQSDRLHDRIRFRKPCASDKVDGTFLHEGVDGWVYERLSP